MVSPNDTCLGVAEIEMLANGEEVAPQCVSHIETCEKCRARVTSAKEDATFVGRVRALSSPGLGPEGSPRLPGYRTVGIVSSGAQGVVYRAVQESTSRTVAIKVLAAGEAATERQRLRASREAEIAARLRHPNIVTVFESRTLSDGRIAVVMEYVDGVPLDTWKPPGETPSERQRALLAVFVAVCNGIHHAHLNGVIHRDLKPDNVLVTGAGRPVVLDFGIAKAGGIQATATGEFAGTPAYASPEQASGRPYDVDALTDVYSLGVILYRLLCGAMPYELEGSIFDIARTISEAEPQPMRTRDPALSPDLEAIVMRAIRKEKDRRYQSAANLARDIERYLAGHPVEARSGSGWYLLRKAVALNRTRLAWVGAAVLLLAGAGAAVVMSLSSAAASAKRADFQREQARAEGVRARAVTELLREALPNADPAHPEFDAIVGSGLGRLYLRLETGEFANEPEVEQAVRRLWGEVYTGLGGGKAAGLVEFAEVSLRNGLVKLRIAHGPEHPEIAATMHELAGVLLVRRRGQEAEKICRSALEMREKLIGPTSTLAAQSRALLARILVTQGRPDEAAREADAALVVFRTLPDAEADVWIASMTALKARVRLNARDAEGAEPLLRETLLRRLRRLSPDDPDLSGSLVQVADLADQRPASALVEEVRAAWGSSAAEFAADVRKAAPLLTAWDQWLSAAAAPRWGRCAALERLLSVQTAFLGKNDLALVRVLIAQMRAGQVEEKLDLKIRAGLRAAELLARRYGDEDPSVLVCIEEASVVLAFVGDTDRAIELARRALAIREKTDPAARDPIVLADTRRHLAWFLALANQCEEAIPIYQRTIEEFSAAMGPESHVVALSQSGLAFCLAMVGDAAKADELSARALEIAQRPNSATHFDQLAYIRFARGHVLMLMSEGSESRARWAEARALLELAWTKAMVVTGVKFPWSKVLLEDRAQACEGLGDAAAAEGWRAQLNGDTGNAGISAVGAKPDPVAGPSTNPN